MCVECLFSITPLPEAPPSGGPPPRAGRQGLHSSTFGLDVSIFCGIRWAVPWSFSDCQILLPPLKMSFDSETRVRKRVNDVAISAGPHGSGRGRGEKAGAGTAGGVRAHQRAPAVSTLSAGMGSSCPRQRSRTLSGAASRGGEECLDSPPPSPMRR